MEIVSSKVNMSALSQYASATKKEVIKDSWVNPPQQNNAVNLNLKGIGNSESASNAATSIDDLKMQLIESIIEALSNKKVKRNKKKKCGSSQDGSNQDLQQQSPQKNALKTGGAGMSIEYKESYKEKQSLDFSANALVKTADGKEITIDLQMSMSREFAQDSGFKYTVGEAKMVDPLVVNYAGNADSLSQSTFKFDLTSDGTKETISRLNAGSGFLALDKNNDGKINDGSELFGTKSGDGFADLQKYDNGNGWIDSGDEIFKQLKIWSPDENGNGKLIGLADVGVGAIYLKGIDSDYTFKDDLNSTLGQNKKTSIFLGENGRGGIIQQIDLSAK